MYIEIIGDIMNNTFYEMIFKRKSFHLFRDTGNEKISSLEIDEIKQALKTFKPLMDNIKIDFKIVPGSETNCNRDEEYCILFYSEKKDNYLHNIGYIGEQLDLYLTSLNIGTLWFGIGKVEEIKYNDLDFVIMMAIKKVPIDKFRKDMYKSKRKEINEMWIGNDYLDVANIVRFSPSACNTQPWIVESNKNELNIYRYKKEGRKGIMPKDSVSYYNKIDIGIFLLFMDVCLDHNSIKYDKQIFIDNSSDDTEKTLVATYNLKYN